MADIASLSGVYQIVNAINGKRYVGSAATFKNRWKEHRARLRHNAHKNKHLQAAWNKYGEASFSFEVIECCRRDRAELIAHEQVALDRLQPEYNKSPTAGSTLGAKLSPETRAKMAMRILSSETRAKISAALKGRSITLLHKAKISAAKKGREQTPAQLAARRDGPRSVETRSKMSAARRGLRLSPAHKAKIASALRGREITDRQRAVLANGRAIYNAKRLEMREAMNG